MTTGRSQRPQCAPARHSSSLLFKQQLEDYKLRFKDPLATFSCLIWPHRCALERSAITCDGLLIDPVSWKFALTSFVDCRLRIPPTHTHPPTAPHLKSPPLPPNCTPPQIPFSPSLPPSPPHGLPPLNPLCPSPPPPLFPSHSSRLCYRRLNPLSIMAYLAAWTQ